MTVRLRSNLNNSGTYVADLFHLVDFFRQIADSGDKETKEKRFKFKIDFFYFMKHCCQEVSIDANGARKQRCEDVLTSS
jgi:hypothetical protein